MGWSGVEYSMEWGICCMESKGVDAVGMYVQYCTYSYKTDKHITIGEGQYQGRMRGAG